MDRIALFGAIAPLSLGAPRFAELLSRPESLCCSPPESCASPFARGSSSRKAYDHAFDPHSAFPDRIVPVCVSFVRAARLLTLAGSPDGCLDAGGFRRHVPGLRPSAPLRSPPLALSSATPASFPTSCTPNIFGDRHSCLRIAMSVPPLFAASLSPLQPQLCS